MATSRKIINTGLSLLFAAALFLFILSFSISLPIYFRPFYYAHIGALNLAETSGFTAAEIKEAYNAVLDYLTLPGREFSAGVLAFSPDGAAHFADCKVLFNLNAGVRGLEGHTAGGRIRFKTDSPFIALKAEYWLNNMPHMPLSGSSGFDIYMQKTAILHIYIPPFQKPIANTVLNISKNSLLK